MNLNKYSKQSSFKLKIGGGGGGGAAGNSDSILGICSTHVAAAVDSDTIGLMRGVTENALLLKKKKQRQGQGHET